MNEMSDMDKEKLLYQMETHMKGCMKMVNVMVMAHTGNFLTHLCN